MKPLRYLMQHACFECRKAFKQYVEYGPESTRPQPVCPECSRLMWTMGRTFRAPKQANVKQWRKVEILVRNGITFHSYGYDGWGKFPRLLSETASFVEKVRRKSETSGEKLLRKISQRVNKRME